MINNYWQIRQGDQILDNVHTYSVENIWKLICEDKKMTSPDKLQIFNNDPYSYIYKQDVKNLLLKYYPEFENLTEVDLSKDDIVVNLISKSTYRKFNEELDYQMTFEEYINSEQSLKDRNRNITEVILMDNGFSRRDDNIELQRHYENQYGVKDYSSWYIWTGNFDDEYKQIKIDFEKGLTNNGSLWYIHLDGNDCTTIGTAQISTVFEFNLLMQVYKSKFIMK